VEGLFMETNIKPKRKSEWQLQEAKSMFSEVIKASILREQKLELPKRQSEKMRCVSL